MTGQSKELHFSHIQCTHKLKLLIYIAHNCINSTCNFFLDVAHQNIPSCNNTKQHECVILGHTFHDEEGFKEPYPPTFCNFVDSNWRAASSVRFSSSTFWLRFLKCISWSMDERFFECSLLEITLRTPLSATYRQIAAPMAFWNSLWALSIFALEQRKLKNKNKTQTRGSSECIPLSLFLSLSHRLFTHKISS